MASEPNEQENGQLAPVERSEMGATGFLIFTVVSGLMAFYILMSVLQTCSRYRELKQRTNPNYLNRGQDRRMLSLAEHG